MILLWNQNEVPGFDPNINEIPSLTPYLIDDGKEKSALIVLPGGGYARRAEHEGEDIALWLNSLNISSFVLNYRVAPYKHPYPLMDAKRALRLVRFNAKKWNIIPDKIGVIGFSAGGHLASTLATHFDYGDKKASDPIEKISCRPDAVILCYPVISMEDYTHKGSKLNLLGENPDSALVFALSTHNMVSEDTPPTFIWHTFDDGGVPVENSLLFAQALKEKNVPFEMHIFPTGRHGLGLAKGVRQVENWTTLCAEWLKSMNFIE